MNMNYYQNIFPTISLNRYVFDKFIKTEGKFIIFTLEYRQKLQSIDNNNTIYNIIFQGNVIQNNAKNGVIVQQYDLALREVSRSQAGNYTCVASNVEGDGYSNIVELKIMCEYFKTSVVYHTI